MKPGVDKAQVIIKGRGEVFAKWLVESGSLSEG